MGFLGTVLLATWGSRAVFGVENRVSKASDRAQILSAVCVSADKKITEAFWTTSMPPSPQFREKSLEKRLLE